MQYSELLSDEEINIPFIQTLNSNFGKMKAKDSQDYEIDKTPKILHKREPKRARQITQLIIDDVSSRVSFSGKSSGEK